MTLPSQIQHGFQSLAQQEEETFNLCEAGLLVGKVLKPSLDLNRYRDEITRLSQDLNTRFQGLCLHNDPLQAKVEALQTLFCKEKGFRGDEDAYDDLDHMNMACLLDEKYGTALCLSMLFIHCTRQCGWAVFGLNFPGYNLICIEHGAKRAILDPFQGCIELDAYTLRQMIKVLGGAEAELQPLFYDMLPAKTLFIRHLGAIKAHFLRCDQVPQALEILEICHILEPSSPAFWRDSGLLHARIGQLSEAIQDLKTALKYTTDMDAIRHTERILTDLQNKTQS